MTFDEDVQQVAARLARIRKRLSQSGTQTCAEYELVNDVEFLLDAVKRSKDDTFDRCCKAMCLWCKEGHEPSRERDNKWWHTIGTTVSPCASSRIRELMHADAKDGDA